MHVLIFIALLFCCPVFAADLPVPRFVSLGSDEVNIRAGPGQHYPIKWVMEHKGLPVEIIREYENWRQIRDHEGQEGWVFHTLLSGQRSALIWAKDPVALYKKPKKKPVVAFFSPMVIVSVKRCVDSSCEVFTQDDQGNYTGWIERKSLWGVYEHEIID